MDQFFHYFRIADHIIKLILVGESNMIKLLPSFAPFTSHETEESKLLFTLTVDDKLKPTKKCELIRSFDTGNGDTLVYKLQGGGYQYIIRDIKNRDCCLLRTNEDFSRCACALNGTASMRAFGLNDAIMLIFAFAGSHHSTLLIHASCVCNKGYAYPFIAKSGTGKSTHSNLWMNHIEGTELVNDDNPIIRIIDGKNILYGSPWSGKTPCYRNVSYPLGAVTRIERAAANTIEQLTPTHAFASLLPACSSMKWDKTIYNNICDIVTHIIENIPVFTLHCLPNEEAALLCQQTISIQTS